MKDRPLPLRERLLRPCFYAYPPACRRRDGRAIIDLAKEPAGRSRMAFLREAGGLLAGGMQARARAVRSAAALLTPGCCLPALWLLAMVIGEPPVSAQYLPFVYYGPGVAVACFLAWCLIRRRDAKPARGRASTSA